MLIGGPKPSKDVKRLARPAVGKTIKSRAQAVTLERAITPAPVDLAAAYDGIGPLSPENARLLTDRLKTEFEDVASRADAIGRALELAERREAWKALGYASWTAYVDAEFEVSRRQAGRLLSHRHFMLALAPPPASAREPATLGADTIGANGPSLTEGQTRAVRDDPAKVAKVQRAVAQGVPPAEAVKRVLPPKARKGSGCIHERTVQVTLCADCGRRLE